MVLGRCSAECPKVLASGVCAASALDEADLAAAEPGLLGVVWWLGSAKGHSSDEDPAAQREQGKG